MFPDEVHGPNEVHGVMNYRFMATLLLAHMTTTRSALTDFASNLLEITVYIPPSSTLQQGLAARICREKKYACPVLTIFNLWAGVGHVALFVQEGYDLEAQMIAEGIAAFQWNNIASDRMGKCQWIATLFRVFSLSRQLQFSSRSQSVKN